MKVLEIALITNANKNEAMRKAMASLGNEVKHIDWQKIYNTQGTEVLNNFILYVVHNYYCPDLIFMQIQAKNIIYIDTIKKLKEKGICIINWTGDVRQPLPQWYKDIGALIDLTLFTNLTDVRALRKLKIKSDYLQIGFEDSIFKPQGKKESYPEIVFMGSNYVNVFPLSQQRIEMVEMLRKYYKERFNVYGNNWQTKFLQVTDEATCYRSCKIGINQNHYNLPRFSSDRILRIMGSGAFCLSYHYQNIEKEFKIGEHIDTWKTFAELRRKIDYYLQHENLRQQIAQNGCNLVHKNYTWDKRVEQIKELITKHKLLKKWAF